MVARGVEHRPLEHDAAVDRAGSSCSARRSDSTASQSPARAADATPRRTRRQRRCVARGRWTRRRVPARHRRRRRVPRRLGSRQRVPDRRGRRPARDDGAGVRTRGAAGGKSAAHDGPPPAPGTVRCQADRNAGERPDGLPATRARRTGCSARGLGSKGSVGVHAIDGRELTSNGAVFSWNRITLPQGNFAARVATTRLTYTFTPRMFASALLLFSTTRPTTCSARTCAYAGSTSRGASCSSSTTTSGTPSRTSGTVASRCWRTAPSW